MRGLATCGATDGDKPARLKRSQAVTDITLITSQGLHPFEMPGANAALGALIWRPHRTEDLAL